MPHFMKSTLCQFGQDTTCINVVDVATCRVLRNFVDPQYMIISESLYCNCMSATPNCLSSVPHSIGCHHGEYTKCKEAF